MPVKIKKRIAGEEEFPSIYVGDWLLINHHICVIAQTDPGIIKMIVIEENNSNRFNDRSIQVDDITSALSNEKLNELLESPLSDGDDIFLLDVNIEVKPTHRF